MPEKKLLLIGIDQAIPYLVDKFLDEGILPNVARLAKHGVKGEALSCFPPDTPTNWATVATGANVEKHGATSFYLHMPGEHLDEGVKPENRSRSQLSKFAQAEYLWDVADREGLRPFVLNYPAGWPANFREGIMSLLTWRVPDSVPFLISGPKEKIFQIDEGAKLELLEGKENIIGEVQFGKSGEPLLSIRGETLQINEWSSWIKAERETEYGILPCLFKVRFQQGTSEDAISVQYSSMYSTLGWSQPASFADSLIRNAMKPEIVVGSSEGAEFWFEGSSEVYLGQARQEAELIGDTVIFAKEAYDWRTCFFHVHFLDSINHKELAYLHKESPLYSERAAARSLENVRTAYQYIDALVGRLLDSVVDDNTVVIFVADHGAIPAWRVANIAKALVMANLLVYKQGESLDTYVVDWTKTKAFPYLEPPYIWVNKEGRNPEGIVSQREYDKVRQQIIDVLMSIRDPETGKQVVRFAARREEAQHLGQNGERAGDVIFALNPPYEIFDGNVEDLYMSVVHSNWFEKNIVYPAQECFGAHAYYLPTERFGDFSISVPLIITGPGIKEDVELDQKVNLIDLAPTLASLLDIPHPKESQGRILNEIFASSKDQLTEEKT